MYQLLFRHKWAALAFVILTLVSVSALVGREGEESVISRTQDDLVAERASMQQALDELGIEPAVDPQLPAELEEEPVIGFTPDEELIDDTMGFDPSPLAEDDYFYEEEEIDDGDGF